MMAGAYRLFDVIDMPALRNGGFAGVPMSGAMRIIAYAAADISRR